jgi:hypothetical protein
LVYRTHSVAKDEFVGASEEALKDYESVKQFAEYG